MNDSKNNPKPLPPDDFSATTPNIRVPKQDSPNYQDESLNDWEKTNYNFNVNQPSSPPADDWNKTAYNVPPAQNKYSPPQQPQDFNKTFMPGQQPPQAPKEAEWGMTQANINLPFNQTPQETYDTPREPYGGGRQQPQQQEFGATTPYISLPQAEREKYQNLPPAATAGAEEKKEEKKGGIPSWLWATGGLLVMFMFAIGFLGLVWYLFFNKTGFDVIVKGAQPNSEVFVDGARWFVTSSDGSLKLQGLKAGQKKILIKLDGFEDDVKDVDGKDGETKEIIAQQKRLDTKPPPPPNECTDIKKGDFEKAAKCANDALDNLKEPFSVEDLLRAMNLYIINFDVNRFNIKPNDMKFLEKASGYMKKLPQNVKIEVGGHTDSDGNAAANQKLSENRANAVKDALLKFGVKQEMLEMRGYGAARPKAPNTTDDGKFQNRRIEYTAIIR